MSAKVSFAATEVGPALSRRMGAAAPASSESHSPVSPMVSPQVSAPGASQDYALFGEKAAPVDENAKTPAARVFPPQGEPVAQIGDYSIFKGFGGVPFRSKSKIPPDLKAADHRQPVITADAAARIFDLGVPEDLLAYTEVWDRATKGYYVAPVEERQWVPEKQTWKIFMRWGVKYWELPDA